MAATASIAVMGVPAVPAALHGPDVSFEGRPALRSVSFNGRVASFTFDRAVVASGSFAAEAFAIGGYRAGSIARGSAGISAVVAISDPRTVLVTYQGTAPDFGVATYGSVAADAVRGRDAPGLPALADSAPLSGALGESGVRGHSAGPELQFVSPDRDSNQLTFTFDQAVDTARLKPGFFAFGMIGGEVVTASAITAASGASVTVAFTDRDIASAARRALVTGPIHAADGVTPAPPAWAVEIPGQMSTSVAPTLIGVTPEADGAFLLTFDGPLGGAVAPAKIHAVTSNGAPMEASAGAIASPSTVRVRFAKALDLEIEHLVALSVEAGAVQGSSGQDGFPSGVPLGSNSGARATGYTTAPDPVAATVNPATGQVTVVYDSRLATIPSASNYALLKPDGSPVAGSASSIRLIQGPGPTQPRVVLQFTPAQVAATRALALGGNVAGPGGLSADAGRAAAVGTIQPGGPDAQSLQTLFAPAGTTVVY